MRSAILSICFIGFFMLSFAQESTDRSDETKWAVKFVPTQMIVGELNIAVEFRTSKRTSLELSFGPAVSEFGLNTLDFEKGPWVEDDDDPVVSDNELTYSSDIGYFGALGFRYYPLPNASSMKGFYVSPEFKYRVFNSIISESTGLWEDVNSQRIEYKFHFNVGYQLWATKAFGFDFFLGGGFGYNQFSEYTPIQTIGATEITYDWQAEDNQAPQLLIVGGLKVAIGG